MKSKKLARGRILRKALRSPGRPPAALRENYHIFWKAVTAGRSSENAALDAGISAPVGIRCFRQAGGMPPKHFSRSSKPLSGRYLSFAEREEIAVLRAQGHGVRSIARRLDRTPSTISRELRRNAATRCGAMDYRASNAQWHADRAARRPKIAKLVRNVRLHAYVQERLAGQISGPQNTLVKNPHVVWKGRRAVFRQKRRWAVAWSPEQISHRLKLDYPEDATMRISHEAIYQALYIQGRGALKRDLTACLRMGRALRLPRSRAQKRGKSFVDSQIMISPEARGGSRSRGTWSLGRRSHFRFRQFSYWHARRTLDAFYHFTAPPKNERLPY